LDLFNERLKMSITNSNITAELISDYAGGRLDAEDTQVIQEAINHDEVIAAAVADARRVNARMHLWLATSTVGASASDAGRTHAGRLQ
jgi:anti-sigma factor RsiW